MTEPQPQQSQPRQKFPYSTEQDVRNFWLKWGPHYFQTIRKDIYADQEAALLKTLNEEFETSKIQTVLDIGCGYGRIAKLLLEAIPSIETYDGFDISQDQLDNARQYVHNTRFHTLLGDFENYPRKFWKLYDLVVCVETMTILPYDARYWMNRVISLSKKYVLTLDWYDPKPNPPAPISQINTWHPYAEYYKANPNILSFKAIPLERYTEYIFIARVR